MADNHGNNGADVVSGVAGAGEGIAGGRKARRSVDSWSNPPGAPPQHIVVAQELDVWLRGLGLEGRRVDIVVGLLDRGYLLSIPLPVGAKGFDDLGAVGGNQLRYLFRRHVATLLGWTFRRSEGTPDGFPAAVDNALRTTVYPGY